MLKALLRHWQACSELNILSLHPKGADGDPWLIRDEWAASNPLSAEVPVQMRNPVFPAVILAERFARLDFLKLADVKCAPALHYWLVNSCTFGSLFALWTVAKA